jgi:hypothetical protein
MREPRHETLRAVRRCPPPVSGPNSLAARPLMTSGARPLKPITCSNVMPAGVRLGAAGDADAAPQGDSGALGLAGALGVLVEALAEEAARAEVLGGCAWGPSSASSELSVALTCGRQEAQGNTLAIAPAERLQLHRLRPLRAVEVPGTFTSPSAGTTAAPFSVSVARIIMQLKRLVGRIASEGRAWRPQAEERFIVAFNITSTVQLRRVEETAAVSSVTARRSEGMER